MGTHPVAAHGAIATVWLLVVLFLFLPQTTATLVISPYVSFLHHVVPPPTLAKSHSNNHHRHNRRRNSGFYASVPFNPDSIAAELRNLGVNVTTARIEVLSDDPILFLIPGFLSPLECRAYREYASTLSSRDDTISTTTPTTTTTTTESTTRRHMTRSNPPEVTLARTKLWPLAILAILSGLPPVVRLFETAQQQTQDDGMEMIMITPAMVLEVVLPNIMIAAVSMAVLAWLVVLPLVRKYANVSSRTSVACALNQVDDLPLIEALVQRACVAAGGHNRHHWEAPVVTRYDPGARFARHGDASPTRGSEWHGLGGQRIITCICYLNTLAPGRGGETYFDQLNVKVRPVAGSALFFFPADATTWQADERTTHESLPVVEEVKWIVQLFGRADVVPPPLGLPPSSSLATTTT